MNHKLGILMRLGHLKRLIRKSPISPEETTIFNNTLNELIKRLKT